MSSLCGTEIGEPRKDSDLEFEKYFVKTNSRTKLKNIGITKAGLRISYQQHA